MADKLEILELFEQAAANAKKLSEQDVLKYMEAYANHGILVIPVVGKTKEEVLKTVSKFVK